MELTKEQQILQQVINEAWENETFKKELMKNPVGAIEKLTGEQLDLNGKELIVRDQTDEHTIFINIPTVQEINAELSEGQLENVAGGCYDQPGPTIFNPKGGTTGPTVDFPVLKFK